MKNLTKEQQQKVKCDVIINTLRDAINQAFNSYLKGDDPSYHLFRLSEMCRWLMHKIDDLPNSIGTKEYKEYDNELLLYVKERRERIDLIRKEIDAKLEAIYEADRKKEADQDIKRRAECGTV